MRIYPRPKNVTLLIFFIFLAFSTMYNSTPNVLNSDLYKFNKSAKPDSVIITGTLVNKTGKPLKGKSMVVYIANSKTTIETHKKKQKKPGLGEQVKGTGKLAMNVKGVDGGGAIKLIDGAVCNPNAKTDNNGNFIFKASSKFIKGETELLIAVHYLNASTMITDSYPLINKEGNPWILKIDPDKIIIRLGKVRTPKE